MLGNSNVMATIAVKDVEKAKEFYGGTLGLEESAGFPGGVTYNSGTSIIFVYESEFAGTNKATSASWVVSDAESEVNELKEKGVTFEQYDFPGMKREGDIHVMDGEKAAWFKDPDGNILAISQSS